MAADREDKTEAPTPRRRSEARSKGQVARSQDLTSAILLLSAFIALRFFAPGLMNSLLAIISTSFQAQEPTKIDEVLPFALAIGNELLHRLGPYLLIVMFSGFAILFAQVGPLLTFHPLIPSLTKINPINGLKRLFSIRSVMVAVINVGKLVVVGAVAYLSVTAGAAAILFASSLDFADVLRLLGVLMFKLCMQLSAALLILALLDFAWQKYRHERDLKMTKEEIKDEFRSMEGDPAIKRRRRQVQLQLSMQRLQKDVPTADVIVTNPTHISVAIRYDMDTMTAPKVVAKGADEVAIRIRQIAKEHGIPLVERRPLARALFEAVEVGQYIPDRFYQAIAEILAYIYELTGRSGVEARGGLVGAT